MFEGGIQKGTRVTGDGGRIEVQESVFISQPLPFPVPVSDQEKGNDQRQPLPLTAAKVVDTQKI